MEENQSLLELQVDRDAATNLMEVSRWGKLLGLLIVIGFGLFFILAIFAWSRLAGILFTKEELDPQNLQFIRIGILIAFLVMGAVLVIMMSFLIKGANRIRLGIKNRDQITFNSGLAGIKNYFAMYGVIALIGLFFSLIGLITK